LRGVGFGPSAVVLGLIIAGTATLVRTGFPAMALVAPVCAAELLLGAGAQQYPLWDPRTSTWFTVLLAVVSLVGVIGLVRLAWHLLHLSGPRSAVWIGLLIATATLGTAVGSIGPFLRAARDAVDTTTPLEDVHGQVETIEDQRRPGDVVLANVDAGFGLGVYWPAQPQFLFAQARLDTFRVAFPPSDRVVVATTISTAAEVAAVQTAVAMAADTSRGRVWVVFSHWHQAERATMISALQRYGHLTVPSGQHGLEPVMLLVLPSHVGVLSDR